MVCCSAFYVSGGAILSKLEVVNTYIKSWRVHSFRKVLNLDHWQFVDVDVDAVDCSSR